MTIIVRDDPTGLKRCLESVRRILLTDGDEICVLDTGSNRENLKATREVAGALGANLHEEKLTVDISDKVREWLPEWYDCYSKSNLTEGCLLSFAAARSRCSELAKHPVQFWIDSDDELVENVPGQFRWAVDSLFGDKGLNGRRLDSLFLEYKYAFDRNDGSCITTLKRERVVDTRLYHWVGRCHETFIPKDDKWDKIIGAGFFDDLKVHIKHHKEFQGDGRPTDIRNYVILRTELEECKADGKPIDPRTVFYLGNACRGLSRDSEALEHYQYLYDTSGSLDDRYLAMYYSGMIWINDQNRRPLDALDCFFRCMRLRPTDPRAYFAISRCYYALGRHTEAIQYFEQGRRMKPLPINLHADDPQHSELLPYQVAAMAARELGQSEYAQSCAEIMNRNYPDHPLTKSVVGVLQNDGAKAALVDGVMRLVANEVGPDKKADNETVKDLVRYHMAKLKGFPEDLEKQGIAPKEPDRDIDVDKEVIFFCGGSIEPFGPKTTGLGGSEKMVAYMAPALQKLGLQVSVYCNCPREQRGIDEETGVLWWHWGGLDMRRDRGTVIFWRSPEMLELPINCRKRILWCHDVQEPRRWNDVRAALADQVWVLSEYHATTLGHWREKLGDKVRITRNCLCEPVPIAHKKPGKIIFASSPDRGVMTAIDIFERLQERGPTDAELHIFYGFSKLFMEHNVKAEYRHIPDLGRDANGWEYMQAVHKRVDANPKIHWHGRVTWEEMAKHQAEADVWLYPTRFPEISCMAAMEAQAAGCKIVATDYAALKETILWDSVGTYKIDANDTADAANELAKAVDNPHVERRALSLAAADTFSIDGLAKEWRALISE